MRSRVWSPHQLHGDPCMLASQMLPSLLRLQRLRSTGDKFDSDKVPKWESPGPMLFPDRCQGCCLLIKTAAESKGAEAWISTPKMCKMMGSTARPGGHVDHGETQPTTLVQMTLIKAAMPIPPSCQLTADDTVPQEVQGPSSSTSWKAFQAWSRERQRAMRVAVT